MMIYRLTAALVSLLIVMAPAQAAPLDGAWTGSGVIKPRTADAERVRCRVSYSRLSQKVYSVSATCASASNTIRQTGELLMIRPNLFVGDFHNQQFDIRGRIRVVISGATQRVTMSSPDGSGSLRLRRR